MLAERYFGKLVELLKELEETQMENINNAAGLISDAIKEGKSIFVFGCSHSAILTEEVLYRAGGLMLINPIFGPGLTLDIKPVTLTSQMERLEGYGKTLLDFSPVSADDVLIVISNSGRNAVPVEMAMEAKNRGIKVIALTSLAYSQSVSSRHSSGKRLFELADVVLDNCCPTADAILEVEGLRERIGPGSTIAGAALMNAIMIKVVENLMKLNIEPPIYVSANLEGGEEHNRRLLGLYKSQIHYL